MTKIRPAWLVLNSGSSSLKFAIHAADNLERLTGGKIEGINSADAHCQLSPGERWALGAVDHCQALGRLLEVLDTRPASVELTAVTHRIVHGGEQFHSSVRIDVAVRHQLEALIPLAPLHQPHNLRAVDVIGQWRPGIAQFACFDTAFHHQQPAQAREFALPRALTDAGILRYGFHGLSYEYIADVLPRVAGHLPDKCIVAHLGNGASLCALKSGRSIATSMGFTPLDGIPMGTRPGQLDPGVVLYLQKVRGMSVNEVEELLYRQSGLLGMSGISADVRELLASSAPAAAAALYHFTYRINREIGSLAAALGGLDALVFTGGIGEHAAPIRAAVCEQAEWLGIVVDADANRRHATAIHPPGSKIEVWVIPTDEEVMMARHTRALLQTAADN